MPPESESSTPRRVEAYLDHVLAPLAHALSPFQREEVRRELRAHLWARVAAYREIGHPEDEAVTEALRQFGGAEDFLRQWRRGWIKTTSRVTWPEVWQATRLALPLSLSALPPAFLLQLFVFYQINVNRDGPSVWLYSHYNTFSDVWVCLCFLLPVALGLTVRRRAGNSAALGMFAALTAGCLLGSLMEVISGYLWEFYSCGQIISLMAGLAALWMWMKTELKAKVTLREVWEAARPALRPTAAGIVVAFLPATVIHISYCNLQGSPAGAFLYSHSGMIFQTWFSFAYLLMPAIVGIRQGRRNPTYARIGMLATLVVEIALASLLYELVGWALPYRNWGSSVGFFVESDGGILLGIMAVWIPVATAAAAASGWWTRRLQARRLA